MKNIKLTTLLLFLLTFQLFSQENNTEKFKIGLNLGVNLFDINQNEFFDKYESMISYTFGLSFEYKLNEKLSLISNINYDRKMMILEDYISKDLDGNYFTIEDKLKFSYINIPVLIRYYVGNKNKIFVNAGGFYNYSLNIENDTTVNETGEDITLFDSENILQKYDYGASLGIGFGFNLNDKNHFSIELKDELGLANIANYPNTSLTDLKTNTIKLILNWELPIQ